MGKLDIKKLKIQKIKIGFANNLSFSPNGNYCVIQKHGNKDYSYWKRYKGGMKGEIFIENKKNKFEKLISLNGNLSSPMWINKRIYFLSDHEGIGKLYSCNVKSKNFRLETEN